MVETVSPEARRRRRWIVALVALVVVAGFLGVNTVSVLRQTTAASGDQVVRLEDGDLRVVEDGPRDAPALLLIHGYAGSTAWWDPVLAQLADDYHVIRVDLLGHGGSAKPESGYDMPAQGRRMAAVLDRLGVDRALVIAHSMGGLVATALAEQRPTLVAALALINTAPSNSATTAQGFLARLIPVPVVGELLWRFRTDAALRNGLGTAFYRDIPIPDRIVADVRAMTYTSFTRSPKESARYRSVRPLPNRLAGLDLPLLVIFGTEDERVHASSAEEYRTVPGVRIETLPGVGHTPMLEDPQRTVDLLRSFIDSVAEAENP
ncbi:alpha/beta fold hydrolase [Nocardia uniformis]|uniref:Alpha/beta fold hydrolase n=1 Tax=Nocardia uniformis TaxID=53432 RepID=A0A849BYZ4_9NOCA|nr:alpha/beta fold hydrolase [Nocardia uniformis]NNH68887.1 alpha/beta fold hydrolase [Nocardia uniformis]